MRLKAILGAGALAVVTVLAMGTANAAARTPAGAARSAPAAKPAAAGMPRTVTLITGDRLTVNTATPDRVTVHRGPGRAGITFLTRTVGGHLQVIPSDALPLLHAGRLDSRLFDVTTLLGFGYDDRRADLPLIVTYERGAARTLPFAAGTAGGRDLPAVNGQAVREPRASASTFWSGLAGPAGRTGAAPTLSGRIAKVWLDGIRKPVDDVSNPQIGAPDAWAAGFTGTGVTVAVVDTGIDSTHPDLAGKVLAEQHFTDDGDALDHVGHGTHVASTIAGTGAASGGRYKGVAPDAKLVDAKVCQLDGCADSWILAGMQWAAADQHAKIVNMSLGGPDSPGDDPLEQAVDNLTAQYGTLFVIAAGNDGRDGTVSSPGTADSAISVGAVDKTDALAFFSSRGPRTGDYALKPDITAPGVDITAARGKDGVIGNPGDLYVSLSGTSMATPHVTGSAAILAQVHPDWTPAQLKAGLMAAAKPNPATAVYGQGAGRVDIGRGIHQSVTTSPASLSFGLAEWPHSDDQPITRTVTYHNYGTAPVTLSLALHTADQAGKPTPAGVFTVSASQVTVPAGGDASVEVTADTRSGITGLLGGQLTATAGDTVVQTPLAIDSEVESYNLTLSHLDRDGNPARLYDTLLVNLDDPSQFFDISDPSGTGTLRLPKARYLVSSVIISGDVTKNPTLSMLAQPVLTLAAPVTETVDARQAGPISVTIPQPDATQLVANAGFLEQISSTPFSSLVVSDSFATMFVGQLGPTTPVPGFVADIDGQWGKVAADGTPANSPYAYDLGWFSKGRMFTGFQRTVSPRDLATVRVDMAHEADGVTGGTVTFGALPDGSGTTGFAVGFPGDLPGSRTQYVNNDSGVQWFSSFEQDAPSTDPQIPFPTPVSFAQSAPTTYLPGRAYREQWNQGVFSPVLPARPFPEAWLTRAGDTLNVFVPLFGDSAGREGDSVLTNATTTITKDGTTIATSTGPGGQFTLPADPGTYRVQIDYGRGTPFTLSMQGSVAWTFTSAHVSGDTPVPVPVSVVRFLPALDQFNRVTCTAICAIPVQVQRQPDSTAGRTGKLTVQVSYDDGAHWTPVLLFRLGTGGVAFTKHPDGHGFASFRTTEVDSAGNSVEQTIIRAFGF